jgi:hypothetical protein
MSMAKAKCDTPLVGVIKANTSSNRGEGMCGGDALSYCLEFPSIYSLKVNGDLPLKIGILHYELLLLAFQNSHLSVVAAGKHYF